MVQTQLCLGLGLGLTVSHAAVVELHFDPVTYYLVLPVSEMANTTHASKMRQHRANCRFMEKVYILEDPYWCGMRYITYQNSQR